MNELLEFGEINDREEDIDEDRHFDETLVNKRMHKMIGIDIKWSLENNCGWKFRVGQRVVTRGDMGSFNLVITKIHNEYYAECRDVLLFGILGKRRHINMNCLEKE